MRAPLELSALSAPQTPDTWTPAPDEAPSSRSPPETRLARMCAPLEASSPLTRGMVTLTRASRRPQCQWRTGLTKRRSPRTSVITRWSSRPRTSTLNSGPTITSTGMPELAEIALKPETSRVSAFAEPPIARTRTAIAIKSLMNSPGAVRAGVFGPLGPKMPGGEWLDAVSTPFPQSPRTRNNAGSPSGPQNSSCSPSGACRLHPFARGIRRACPA